MRRCCSVFKNRQLNINFMYLNLQRVLLDEQNENIQTFTYNIDETNSKLLASLLNIEHGKSHSSI